MSKSVLVLISGAPGTGKTVLLRKLTPVLPVVVLEKDAIKETLFDALGTGSREWSQKLGTASFDLLYMLVERHLMAKQSVVAEAALHLEYAGTWLDRMKQKYDFDVLELHCHADPDLLLQRYLGRKGADVRHLGHGFIMSQEEMADDWHRQYHWYRPVTGGH